ncbi:MAG: CoA pyrophosphatase [Proteobacteria bacterium]|nr:CoA pyrophosphatase [Pseudomonadota bacterium]
MPTLDRIRQALAREPFTAPTLDDKRDAAVAAILNKDLDLLLIRRATRERDPWSGHLSFPGGRRDPTDFDMLHTARRETVEEVGLDLSNADLLGRLDDVATKRPVQMLVRPYVFAVEDYGDLKLEASEVAGIHTLPVAHLLQGRGRSSFTFQWQGNDVELPKVDFDDVMLWGLTLQLIDDLLHRLDGQGTGLRRPTLS